MPKSYNVSYTSHPIDDVTVKTMLFHEAAPAHGSLRILKHNESELGCTLSIRHISDFKECVKSALSTSFNHCYSNSVTKG